MTYRYLTDLDVAVRKSGLRVVEIAGWKSRGRPASTGGFNPRGVLCHHTGGADDGLGYAKWLGLVGRSDLPAPLCQLALGRDGTVYIIAAGRANHAGVAKAQGSLPAGDGNELYLGIEAMNTGSEGWTKAQYDAYVRLVRALIQHYGWQVQNVRGHRETSVTGKVDPGRIDLDKFRSEIGSAAAEQEDDVSAKDVWNYELGGVKAGVKLTQAKDNARQARIDSAGNRRALDALADKLEALAPGVKAAVAEALAEGITLEVKAADAEEAGAK